MVYISLTQTGAIFAQEATISFVFSSLLQIIISGLRSFMVSIWMVFVPPTMVFSPFSEFGWVQN